MAGRVSAVVPGAPGEAVNLDEEIKSLKVKVDALRHNIIATITPERKVELQWACVVMALAVLLLLAGPAIEGALGAWTLGFAPIAQCMVIGAVTYMWHSIGETIADARDEQLRQETLDPSQSSIATNYRILG